MGKVKRVCATCSRSFSSNGISSYNPAGILLNPYNPAGVLDVGSCRNDLVAVLGEYFALGMAENMDGDP